MNKALEYLKDKIAIFDMDGVLTRYDFQELGKGFLTDEWISINVKQNLYLDKGSKTELFDEAIKELGNNAWVLSVALTIFEQRNKIEVLQALYPTIPEEQILFCAESRYKIPLIESLIKHNKLHNNTNKKIVLIEDKEELVYDFVGRYKGKETPFELRLVSDFF